MQIFNRIGHNPLVFNQNNVLAKNKATSVNLMSSQKINKELENKSITNLLSEKVGKTENIKNEPKEGFLTNVLTELLKITEELKELKKSTSPELGFDAAIAISEQSGKLTSRFNQIVSSDTFKRATRVLKKMAQASDRDSLLSDIKTEYGSQGKDLTAAVNFGGIGAVKSLARTFGALEELRLTNGGSTILKLARNQNGEVIQDINQAYETDLNLDSLSNLIGSGLNILKGQEKESHMDKVKNEAVASIKSFIEQLLQKNSATNQFIANYRNNQNSSNEQGGLSITA